LAGDGTAGHGAGTRGRRRLAGIVEIGKLVVANSAGLWGFRVAGLAAGVLLALPVARAIGQRYQAWRTSEQMLFVDGWWALLTPLGRPQHAPTLPTPRPHNVIKRSWKGRRSGTSLPRVPRRSPQPP